DHRAAAPLPEPLRRGLFPFPVSMWGQGQREAGWSVPPVPLCSVLLPSFFGPTHGSAGFSACSRTCLPIWRNQSRSFPVGKGHHLLGAGMEKSCFSPPPFPKSPFQRPSL